MRRSFTDDGNDDDDDDDDDDDNDNDNDNDDDDDNGSSLDFCPRILRFKTSLVNFEIKIISQLLNDIISIFVAIVLAVAPRVLGVPAPLLLHRDGDDQGKPVKLQDEQNGEQNA